MEEGKKILKNPAVISGVYEMSTNQDERQTQKHQANKCHREINDENLLGAKTVHYVK